MLLISVPGGKITAAATTGTRQRTYAHFVHSGDMNNACLPQHAFEVKHCVKTLSFLHLIFGTFGEHLVEFSRTGSRIALEASQNLC